MHGFTFRMLGLLTLIAILPAAGVEAAGRIGKKKQVCSRPDADKAYCLNDIMKQPKQYLEREVFFYARFATTANLYKNVHTRFNSNEHANFAVWPDGTVLWEEEGRKNVLPTLYVSKLDAESLEVLRTIRKYELVAITGTVMNVYSGYPWIQVTSIRSVEVPGDVLCDQVVEHMQAGYEALSKNFGGVAARHFEQALQFGLPSEYVATAYKQLACAYYLDNQYDKAQDYLRLAVQCDPADPLLHLALADVSLRMGDYEEAIAHSVFAMERSGRYPQVYGIMGEAKSMMGDYVEAFNDLNTAANTPGITPRERAMVNVRRARIYTRAERYVDAAQVYAAVSEPGEPLGGEAWLHNEVGLFYESLFLISDDERYLDSARQAYTEASRLSRLYDADILYNNAEAEFRLQRLSPNPDFTEVRNLIQEINTVEAEYPPARILEGRVLFAEGNPEEADQRYQSVVRMIGQNAKALLSLAEAYMELGMFSDAITTVRRARGLEPWNQRVQAIGSYIENHSGEVYAQAEPVYEYIPAPEYQYVEPGYESQPYVPEYYQPQMVEPEIIVPHASVMGGNGLRPPADGNATYRVNGQLVTVRPGQTVRAGNGTVRAESRSYPQDIQASAGPVNTRSPYPKTEVRLGDNYPHQDQESLRPAPIPDVPPYRHESGNNNSAAPRMAPQPLNLGYDAAPPDDGYERRGGSMVEPLDFGMITGSGEALASLPVWNDGELLTGDDELPPFTFDPDASPVLIAKHRAPGRPANTLPVRNANLYRRAGGGRQPAEVIEKETVAPEKDDASVMAPAKDGKIHRAEVRLPSSTIGVGMTSDFQPGR